MSNEDISAFTADVTSRSMASFCIVVWVQHVLFNCDWTNGRWAHQRTSGESRNSNCWCECLPMALSLELYMPVWPTSKWRDVLLFSVSGRSALYSLKTCGVCEAHYLLMSTRRELHCSPRRTPRKAFLPLCRHTLSPLCDHSGFKRSN